MHEKQTGVFPVVNAGS